MLVPARSSPLPSTPHSTWREAECEQRADQRQRGFIPSISEQSQRTETRVAAAADHDMVVDGDADRLKRLRHRARHVDIRLRRRRVARWMIVNQYDSRGAERQRALYYFARIYRRMIDGAALLRLIGDERVLLVEKEQAELFHRGIAGGDRDVVEQRLPGADHR